MTVAVPADRLEKELAARLQRLSKTARFPGFRPGKAPMKMVEAQYGGKVLEEVVGDLIRSTFYEAVSEKGLKPAGGPNIEPKHVDRGRDFEYTASFEVYPEVTRLDIRGSRIERPVVEVTDEDVARTIESLRQQRVGWRPVERAAAIGDRVVIDFQGSVDGEPFEGGAATDFPLVLGNHVLIEGFETGLVGAKSGETRNLDLRFPVDYRNAALAGKPAQFAVTIKQVNEPVLPDVNEDFARALGVADGNVDGLRREVRGNLERERDDRIRRLVRDRVFRVLTDGNDFDIPKAMEQEEIQRLIKAGRANLEARGFPAGQLPADPALYAPQARSRVKLGLILAEIIRHQGLKPDPAKVRARIEELAAAYDDPREYIAWHYANPARLADAESQVLEDQVVELLLQTAETIDKPMSFQELVRPEPPGN
jgi:trigger factor